MDKVYYKFDHVELRLRWAYGQKNPRTEIDIEEVTDEST